MIANLVDPLPLSLLNDFLYCPRRAGLKGVDGLREGNEHTVLGSLAHEQADLPGYGLQTTDDKLQIRILRALPVWSERLGLSGKCDVVEVELTSTSNDKSQMTHYRALRPVEYKKGKRRPFENDDAQLCAQALCLEEMFGVPVTRGAIFHAASKRRREVEFTAELRQLTENGIAALRRMIESGTVPMAVFRPACEECSLYRVCLPELTSAPKRCEEEGRRLFTI